MSGPCLCGDLACPWCGPLQGGGPGYDADVCEFCGEALTEEEMDDEINVCDSCALKLGEALETRQNQH